MDAQYILHVLEMFDGKLSITDILTMDLPLLTNLESIKKEQLTKQANDMRALHNKAQSNSQDKKVTTNRK